MHYAAAMDHVTAQSLTEAKPKHTPLVLGLAARIRDLIQAGEFAEGTKLAAQSLADHFQVSRSPVREALALLAQQGLIEQIPNRGFSVKALPPEILERTELLPRGASHAYYQLAEDWLSDRIPADVTEQMLRDRYHLTRGQVADMLLTAMREGWAERKQGYGWRLLPVAKTPESFEQIFRFRMIIEPAGMLEPTFQADPQVLSDLRRVQERMLDSDIDRLPAERLLEAGSTFHEELLRLSGNPFLHLSLIRVNRMRRLLEYRTTIDRARLTVQCTDHLRILDSLEQGEVHHASALMLRHLGGALERKSPITWKGFAAHPRGDQPLARGEAVGTGHVGRRPPAGMPRIG